MRARQGLRPGVVERAQLETIADRVAGVARFGIQSLRAADEIADERDHTAIRSPATAVSLGSTSRTATTGWVTRSTTATTERRSGSARRKKLKKLRAYDLIDWEGDGAAREYWVCDESLSSSIDFSRAITNP